ncbi:MAG: hypothetical protein SFZ23_11950 [Planctomycetota bacterium]|nr:hypothetical protein [Planctomycetota bacterium]
MLDELEWPRLLSVPRLALAPHRVGLGFFALLLLALLLQLARAVGPRDWTPWREHAEATGELATFLAAGDLVSSGAAFADLLLGASFRLLTDAPWSALVFFPPAFVVVALLGGAIARSVACEFAQRVRLSWTESLAFSWQTGVALVGALVAPIAIVLLAGLGLGVLGWALFSLPWVNVVGALLLPLGLLIAAFVVGFAFLLIAGHPMLLASIACERTDAIEGVQRVLAYVVARPLRLLLYSVLAIVQGLVVVAIFLGLAAACVHFATAASSMFLDGPERGALLGVDWVGRGWPVHVRTVARLVNLWAAIPFLLVAGLAFSIVQASGVAIYLLLRRACDGQDVAEIWVPSMLDGTFAPAVARGEDEDES